MNNSWALHYRSSATTHATVESGVFRGGGALRLPPLQPTIIFYDAIFGCFTNFSSKTSKFRHSVTIKRQLLVWNKCVKHCL